MSFDRSTIKNHLPDLVALKQWVCWKAVPRTGGKTDKITVQPDGTPANHSDPETWSTFEDCCRAASRFSGVGFVFSESDPFCGIDLDHCLSGDPGQTLQIVELFASYCEVSPSGEGLHVIIRGKLPSGVGNRFTLESGQKVEIYDRTRFFTMTGQVWGVNHAD